MFVRVASSCCQACTSLVEFFFLHPLNSQTVPDQFLNFSLCHSLSLGFCMDLLNRLAEKVNFSYEVHLSEDGSYGSLRRVSQ